MGPRDRRTGANIRLLRRAEQEVETQGDGDSCAWQMWGRLQSNHDYFVVHTRIFESKLHLPRATSVGVFCVNSLDRAKSFHTQVKGAGPLAALSLTPMHSLRHRLVRSRQYG